MAVIDTLSKAKAKLLLKQAFFATIIMSVPMRATTAIPTAATDMKTIFYNEEFIEGLESIELVMFVICHEVLHIVFKHGLRCAGRNMDMWNIACDHAINLILKESRFKIWGKAYCDPRFTGMSAEQIYDILMKENNEDEKDGRKPRHGCGGMGGEDGTGTGRDLLPVPKGGDPAEQAVISRGIDQKVASAAFVARVAGQLPGDLERLVKDILEPQITWQQYLQEYMTRVSSDDECWSKRNRRFKVYLPRRWSECMGEVVCIGDTSGSIGNDELAAVASETASIAQQMQPERIRMIWCDADVAGEQVFEMGEPIVCEPKGGGGTDMRKALTYVEQFEPVVVILHTDGYTPWPDEEPPYPLIVVCTTKKEVPWGQVIRV